MLPRVVFNEEKKIELVDGQMIKPSSRCKMRINNDDQSCIRHYAEMIELSKKGISTITPCPYGFHSASIIKVNQENEVIFTGFIASATDTNKKMPKNHKNRVNKSIVIAFLKHFYNERKAQQVQIENSIRSSLNAVHDLRQVNRSISATALRLLKTMGIDIREVGENAINDNDASRLAYTIYKSSELISNILVLHDIAENPSRASMDKKLKNNIHRLFTKISRILDAELKKRRINVRIIGDTITDSFYHKSISLIPIILLDNAIKYSRVDSEVLITLTNYHSNKIKVVFDSSGFFIKPEDAQKVFELGNRGKIACEIEPNGSGIGLYVLKIICDAHNGTVIFNSIPESYYLNDKQCAVNKFIVII